MASGQASTPAGHRPRWTSGHDTQRTHTHTPQPQAKAKSRQAQPEPRAAAAARSPLPPPPSEGRGVDGKTFEQEDPRGGPAAACDGDGATPTRSSSHSDPNVTPRPAPRPRREMIPATANNTVGHASGRGGADPAELDARGEHFSPPRSPRRKLGGRLDNTAGIASRTLVTGFGHALRPTANRHKTHPTASPAEATARD